MSFAKKGIAALVLTGAALAVSSAYAAGFQLTEQSSLGLGRAYAGAGIVGDDLSAVHYNPAGMTLLEGTRVQAGFTWIALNADIDGAGAYAGQSENGRLKGQAIPTGYVTHQVNDQVWLGFGMSVPYGMGTEYGNDWFGANRGIKAKIYTFDMNPNIAWKVNDLISLGAGLSVQYAKADLSMNAGGLGVGEIDADSWDWGFNLGVMISPTDTLRFGLSYRSSIEHNAEGDFSFATQGIPGVLPIPMSQTLSSEATVKTPDTIMLTGTWEATPDLRLSGLIRWANWSNFDTLTIKNDISGMASVMDFLTQSMTLEQKKAMGEIMTQLGNYSIHNKWQDTWLFSVGADYRINDAFTVRGGIAYETSPIDDETTRMAVIPDTDRLWLSLGATYHFSKDLQFDVGATYLMGVGDMDLYKDYKNNEKIGEYQSLDAYLIGFQAQYRF
ncbi:MAG TPA: outer membrane protein transport protein [Candidatus Aphodousia gallistercoris]|nr:outer membrane protein transport protein [Candidatus Aphodousia gallistercoris]